MITDIVMLRHGRTSMNLERRLQGQVEVPLDIIGQWQADQSGFALAQRYYWAKVSNLAAHPEQLPTPPVAAVRAVDVEEYRKAPAAARTMVVVSSDLFRAQQTAHAFADILGLEVHLDPRLRERSFGEWEGMTREEILARWPEDFHAWKRHEGGELAHGVESRREVGARGAEAIRSYVRQARDVPGEETLFVVSHGSWIVATIATLLGMDVDDANGLDAMRNAFWSRMSLERGADGDRWLLAEFNRGPQIAEFVDWENGPEALRNPDMPTWKPIAG
ncbi:histidine phosphatase family protein [Bifidobacterium castoris]|uniref:Phosphoglycerate mutase n=1 Tax=Bifidobacterium castoris TaxID=2306972 RepID=A0A430F7K0_9BIFI|nr:histidine phosphatase family protein [Bifidobacterium castoris]RSX48899.1 phosphoglycerate mutase [Bifidobacterium castoris]